MSYRQWLISRVARAKRDVIAAERALKVAEEVTGCGDDGSIYLTYETQAALDAYRECLRMLRMLEPKVRK